MLTTGKQGHAHYFEFFVYDCKSVRPYLSPLRTEDRAGFANSPLFVDLVGLPDASAFAEARLAMVADSRQAKLPVAIPTGEVVPGAGRRPELARARAYSGESPAARAEVVPAPGANALIYVPAATPPSEPLADPSLMALLDAAASDEVSTVYAPSPRSLAADAAGVDALREALAERGARFLYATDPEPMAIRALAEDSLSASVVMKAVRSRRWRVEVRVASEAARLADRQRLTLRRDDARRRLTIYAPAGLRALELVRRVGHELLQIDGCPRLAAPEVSGEEARALAALWGVLADDLLRRRFGGRLRSLRLGVHEWAISGLGARRTRRAQARMVEVAAAVAELLCAPEGYDLPRLLAAAEQVSPAGVALGRRAFAAIRGVGEPTDYESLARALESLRGEVPLPGVSVVVG